MTRVVKDVAASVQARLRKIARDTDVDLQIMLNRFAIERLLYRLGRSPERASFVLKGATLFTLWSPKPYRITRDLDLLGRGDNDVDALIRRFQTICATAVEDDGVTFTADDIEATRIHQDDEYAGVRIWIPARIGNARVRIQVDVGFGDAAPGTTEARFPTYLDMPAPTLRVYSREASIAEKFDAMVSLGVGNSRMKDFFDVWTYSNEFAFDGAVLARAIRSTFERRGHVVPPSAPTAFTPEFASGDAQKGMWSGFLRRARVPPPHVELPVVVQQVERFLMPPAVAITSREAFSRRWPARGPWE